MRGFYWIGIAAIAFAALGETASTNVLQSTHTGRAVKRQAVLASTGGRILQPNSGKGVFVIANAQSKIDVAAIQDLANLIQGHTMIEIHVVSDNADMSTSTLKRLNAQMGISVRDEPSRPGLLIAPEEGWAVVNVAPLAKGNDAELNFKKRVRKELYRAFGLLAGGCGSSYHGNLLDPIRTPDDLDLYPESDVQMPYDMMQKLPRFCAKFDLKPWRITTYRRAVHEGWAPQPTNDVQKAIWQEMRQLPTKPILIKFDPKKGK